jgi:hypothetical protein
VTLTVGQARAGPPGPAVEGRGREGEGESLRRERGRERGREQGRGGGRGVHCLFRYVVQQHDCLATE